MELLLVSIASLLAGFVDSIVGGGGLILAPALFAVFPGAHPATLFGVNKGASVWGTAVATAQYARRVDLRWAALLPAAGAGFCGSLAGAWLVTVIDPGFLRKALPFVLLGVLAYFALTMAVANVAGSLLGTRLALRHGVGFVRLVFIGVVSALILKTGFDAFLK
jgi:uncharacterized membrane protein YfcA